MRGGRTAAQREQRAGRARRAEPNEREREQGAGDFNSSRRWTTRLACRRRTQQAALLDVNCRIPRSSTLRMCMTAGRRSAGFASVSFEKNVPKHDIMMYPRARGRGAPPDQGSARDDGSHRGRPRSAGASRARATSSRESRRSTRAETGGYTSDLKSSPTTR